MIDIRKKLTKKHYQTLSYILGAGILLGITYGAYNIAHETKHELDIIATPSEATRSTISTIPEIPETEEEFIPSADKLNLAYCFPEGADESDPLNSYAGEVYKELMTEDNEYLANIYDSAGVSPRALASRMGLDPSRVMGKYNPTAEGQSPDDPSTWYIPNFKNVNVSFYNADGKRVNEYSNVKDIMAMASVYCYAHDYLDVETFRKYCEELYDKSRSYTISVGNVYYDDGCINRSAKEEAEEAHKMEQALADLKQSLLEDAIKESYEAVMSEAAEKFQRALGGGTKADESGSDTDGKDSTSDSVYSVSDYDSEGDSSTDVSDTAESDAGSSTTSNSNSNSVSDTDSSVSSGTDSSNTSSGSSDGSIVTSGSGVTVGAGSTGTQDTSVTDYTTVQSSDGSTAGTAAVQSGLTAQTTSFASGASDIRGRSVKNTNISENLSVENTASVKDTSENNGNIILSAGRFISKFLSIKDMFKVTRLHDRVEAETFAGREGVYYGEPGTYGTAKEYAESLKTGKVDRSESAELTSVTAFVSAASTEATQMEDQTTTETTTQETVESTTETTATTTAESTLETETEESTNSRDKYAKYKGGEGIDIINNPTEAAEDVVETAEASTEGSESTEDTMSESDGESGAETESNTDSTQEGTLESESGESLEESAGEIVLGTFTRAELRNMDDATLLSLLEESMDAEEEKQVTNDETDVHSKKYCPGHVDLYVKVTIYGFEDEKGLKTVELSADDADENEAARTLEAALAGNGWNGWTEDRCREVEKLINQDWFKTYGFSISTINPKNPLTEEEISKYLDGLPEDISSERKAVIKFALESVGKVPYYWGGKASGKNYEANNFGSIVESDYRGRVLRGLDCSGWIQWVYWSAIGDNLNGSNGTSSLIGEGEKIKRADLQPGDIIVRTGADSHVVMFLGWAGNGNMIAIHENSSANNVSVSEVTANYPYYRKLIN